MTAGISIQNALELSKRNFKLAIANPALMALIYLSILPVIHGITNLDATHTAEILEKFVSPIGIIFFVPICRPEMDICIRETVYIKPYSFVKIVGIRMSMATTVMGIIIIAFSGILYIADCDFPFFQYVAGSIITALVLGCVGIMTTVLSNNIIAGYLVSLGFLLLNWNGVIKESSPVYLFSLMNSQFQQKWHLLLIAFVGMVVTIIHLRKVDRHFEKQLI